MTTIEIATATGTHAFQVEVAKDNASRMRGLMGRRSMPPDHGMLFEFDREEPRTFHMTDTYIPLDIIFLSRDGIVTNIRANAQTMTSWPIPSEAPCAAVLELNGGAAAKIGLKIGDKVSR